MTMKLVQVNLETSKVSLETLEHWVRLLLTLDIPNSPIETVQEVRTWVVAQTNGNGSND